jgi:hypothetical protein
MQEVKECNQSDKTDFIKDFPEMFEVPATMN